MLQTFRLVCLGQGCLDKHFRATVPPAEKKMNYLAPPFHTFPYPQAIFAIPYLPIIRQEAEK